MIKYVANKVIINWKWRKYNNLFKTLIKKYYIYTIQPALLTVVLTMPMR